LFLSPICNDQTFDANGDPLNAGQIETYLAGSSTPAATYTDDTGGTSQSNPIILNSLGYPTAGPIWLTGGVSYKFIIKNSAGSTLRTIDDISGVNDASVSQSEWVESGLVPTYISATSFSVPGDQTLILQVGRRLRTTNTSGLVYSTISNSVFAAGITTVTLTNDSTTLDAGLSLIAYALLAADPLSVPNLPGSKITGLLTASGLTMPTGTLAGRASASTGAIEALTPSQASPLLTTKVQPIAASVGSNALTLTLNPTSLDFRSGTAGSGTVNTYRLAAAITLVISSGSTLGTVSATASRLVVLAIDNAGTVELAVVNHVGAGILDESGVISTTAEGGAGGADSASTIYSTTARSNVPYRVVGYVDSTQATAGTWATAPSKIQGAGGLFELNANITQGTPAATTSGTTVSFTGIPSYARRVTVLLFGVSTAGSVVPELRMGSASGGFENSGYVGSTATLPNGSSPVGVLAASGVPFAGAGAAASVYQGAITLINSSGNNWIATVSLGRSDTANPSSGAVSKSLSSTLDRVQIVTADGFDAGSMNVVWE